MVPAGREAYCPHSRWREGAAVEIHQARYFPALCDSLNFTRAAETCGVTEPEIFREIKLVTVAGRSFSPALKCFIDLARRHRWGAPEPVGPVLPTDADRTFARPTSQKYDDDGPGSSCHKSRKLRQPRIDSPKPAVLQVPGSESRRYGLSDSYTVLMVIHRTLASEFRTLARTTRGDSGYPPYFCETYY